MSGCGHWREGGRVSGCVDEGVCGLAGGRKERLLLCIDLKKKMDIKKKSFCRSEVARYERVGGCAGGRKERGREGEKRGRGTPYTPPTPYLHPTYTLDPRP